METVNVGGAELWTDTTGRGRLAIVLCHGGPGLSDNLLSVASMLDDLAVVHRYDQRGGGRSDRVGPYTVAQFVADLDELRAHWGHDEWIVGGHSWGGWLALMYAMRHPSRVTALIGIGMPPPSSDGWREEYLRVREARISPEDRGFFDAMRRRRHAGEKMAPEEERRWTHLMWRTDFADPRAVPDFDRAPLFGFAINDEVNRALVVEMDAFDQTHDISAELRSITASAVFIHGDGDPRPAPVSVIEALPNARLELIPGAGHLPWLERRREAERVLRAFVRSTS